MFLQDSQACDNIITDKEIVVRFILCPVADTDEAGMVKQFGQLLLAVVADKIDPADDAGDEIVLLSQAQRPAVFFKLVLRLDKWRADPARDAARLAELRPLEQRWIRRLAELKGQPDARLDEYRWLLEELRISLFAQELRTPQPVSVKRLDKTWQQLAR